MHYLKYRIRCLAPIVIRTHNSDRNTVATERFIPGSSVQGLLAKRVIARKTLKKPAYTDPEFFEWFSLGSLNVGSAFIASEDKNGAYYTHFPVPLSIRQEKESGNIRDYLFELEDPTLRSKVINTFCGVNALTGNTLQTRDVDTRLNFHHARDSEKGITRPGLIFHYESIEHFQMFEGLITGDVAALKQFLTTCGQSWTGYIGRSRNAQYGKVAVEILTPKPIPYQSQCRGQQSVSLTLVSDTILYNSYGFSTTELSVLEAQLTAAAGTPVRIIKSYMKQSTVETFLSVWNLPRPSETCFLAGSAFLLQLSGGNSAGLEALEASGIGERTHEGFGQCRLDWQRNSGAKPLKLRKEQTDPDFAVQAPTTRLPGQVKEILKDLVWDALKKRVQEIAMEEQKSCTRNLPSKTLCARLEALTVQDSRAEFAEQIYQLRQIARTQLERCRGRGFTLFTLLTGRFMITETVLERLRGEGLSENLLAKLSSLKDQSEIRQQTFTTVLQDTLGETLTDQNTPVILQHAFIPNKDVSAAAMLTTSEKTLCHTIEAEPESDSQLERDLYQLYFSTFFSILRKRAQS